MSGCWAQASGHGCRRPSAPPPPCRTCIRIAAACCCSRSAKAPRPRRAGRPASRCSGRSGSRRSTRPPRPRLTPAFSPTDRFRRVARGCSRASLWCTKMPPAASHLSRWSARSSTSTSAPFMWRYLSRAMQVMMWVPGKCSLGPADLLRRRPIAERQAGQDDRVEVRDRVEQLPRIGHQRQAARRNPARGRSAARIRACRGAPRTRATTCRADSLRAGIEIGQHAVAIEE